MCGVTVLPYCLLMVCLLVHVCYGRGTTANIRPIFIGRCWSYQRFINPRAFKENRIKNCTELWHLFTDAFSHRAPCDVTASDYDAFIAAAANDVPQRNVMLWQRTYPFVHAYTALQRRGTALSDTLPGYVSNGLNWCGSTDDPSGIEYGDCSPDCELSTIDVFWSANSRQFAKTAIGGVRLMLNGSQEPAYRDDSVFAQFELPNLNPQKVRSIHALVVNDVGTTVKERCGAGTLELLRKRVEARGFRFNCTDNPKAMHHLLCVDKPHAGQCQLVSLLLGHNSTTLRKTSSSGRVVISSALVVYTTSLFTIAISYLYAR